MSFLELAAERWTCRKYAPTPVEQEKIDAIDQRVKLALGENQRGRTPFWRVSWTNTATGRIDTKALREKYPDIADEFTKVSVSRRYSVKKVKREKIVD